MVPVSSCSAFPSYECQINESDLLIDEPTDDSVTDGIRAA